MKFHLILISLFFINCQIYSQDKMTLLDKANYSINYPSDWELDMSGKMDTEFLLFSKIEKGDTFRENVNLLIQNLKGENMDMKAFVELSENQVRTMVSNSKLIESKFINDKNAPYHIMIWSGYIANNDLKFKQYFFLKEEKAYVLTYTALQTTFDDYLKLGTTIINSFKLK